MRGQVLVRDKGLRFGARNSQDCTIATCPTASRWGGGGYIGEFYLWFLDASG